MNSDRKKRHVAKDLINRDPDSQFRKKLLCLFEQRQSGINHLSSKSLAFNEVIDMMKSNMDKPMMMPHYLNSVSEYNRNVSEEVVALEQIDRDIANLLNEWDALHRWEDNDASGK